MQSPIKIALIGAGSRGLFSYAPYALAHPDEATIVAVAEPREWHRAEAGRLHSIPSAAQFASWEELLAQPKLADAVIIATPDKEHTEPAIRALKAGYHVLLEKPMATTEEECRRIIAAVKEHKKFLAVCHVLRYTPYFRALKKTLESGVIGQVRTVRHIEQVGFWHHAHSYVRGNWRNSASSSPMILAKCCHDMDILLYLLGRQCVRVSSFGSLGHFTAERRPEKAADRCMDCSLADGECPYSAKSFYLGRYAAGEREWPINVITSDISVVGIEKALREGPYGRCVYASDNDVVDSQVAVLEFEEQIQVSFTMTAFTMDCKRLTSILGSHGEIHGSENQIEIVEFKSGKRTTLPIDTAENSVAGGHMGGDFGIMKDFVAAIRTGDFARITSTAETSLASHLMAFAAERSRLRKSVEDIVL
jgi:predicted dehydrogenase